MRAVKSRGTISERRLAAVLKAIGIRVREHADELPGRPDFVNDRLRLAVFLDGDFWHGRDWFEFGEAPVNNRPYWLRKFEKNASRDARATRLLRRHGWSVVRIWESDLLRAPEEVRRRVDRMVSSRRRRLAG
jgi:DNA mismatch endonuclease (patch repair protein)